MDTLAISAANLDVLEQNLNTLANNVGDVYQSVNNVTGHVNEIDNKVTSVTDTVKTLEEEIKSFMLEIRESSIVGNARQTILMDENELNKKFGHYDKIRRKISGILQSTDMNAIKKSTIESISEESLINTPDYFLSPALFALCAWILDDKEKAEIALKEAIKRDNEKTSLLFCLINLRAGRTNTSIRWLNRYLNIQDPRKMDSKIITVLNAITSGVFGIKAKEICISKVNLWLIELNSFSELKDKEKTRWIKYLKSNIDPLDDDVFPYLKYYSKEYEDIKENISISLSYNKTYEKLQNITNTNNTINIDSIKTIDSLLNMLVFSYEKEDLELRRDIRKNKHIIDSNGDMKKALEDFEDTSKIYDEKSDLLTHLTNIVLENKTTNPSIETRKYALSLEKNIIKDAINDINKGNEKPLNINFKINDWEGSTINGSNEIELKKSLSNYVENLYEEDLSKSNIFNIRMFISIIVGLITMFLAISSPLMVLLIFLVTVSYNIYELYTTYKKRNTIYQVINRNKKNANDILMNIIAEVVDYNIIYKNNLKTKDKIMSYIEGLNPDSFIKSSENEKNIIFEKEV